ncbi:porin family protein [Oceanihabitans sediminis]|uniref:porin family protein n=1 Tax=Oceanihabitans sediminis TaxID=1812012 RepID=UPI003A947746
MLSTLCLATAFSQEEEVVTEVDSLYKEDQFYGGATYNLLLNSPKGISQSGFSSGFHIGFIKDMPINTKRDLALGLGIGLSSNSFNQNMLIDTADDKNYSYTALDNNDISYSKNKFTTYMVEAPLEFRWRTSTATEYKFWRIYTGIKLGYVFANSSKFIGESDIKHSNIADFNKMQYGLTLSVGYNTWNIHVYYGLNPIFNSDAKLDAASIDMRAVKIGLMFYIL